MQNKIAIGFLLMFCSICQVHGAVNCTETGAGRFADTNDTTCHNYTLCVYDSSSSSYVSYNYECPTTSLFNPSTAKCTTNITCDYSGTNSTSTSNSTSTLNVTTLNSSSWVRCSAPGRYANTTDATCKSYYLCVLSSNGTYLEYDYTCPSTTVFNPISKVCTASYACSTL